ncbi:hypothetical protein BSIN_0746 [Burkholderia singularis]|uniref:Uncharacterized protein n=1 Tax=Burkholderia singularis TaxID=1503053 RepID=A0A238H914_9BURK|nr:hypothetical protein BSIN_0746 [Burkholderia singularis]
MNPAFGSEYVSGQHDVLFRIGSACVRCARGRKPAARAYAQSRTSAQQLG